MIGYLGEICLQDLRDPLQALSSGSVELILNLGRSCARSGVDPYAGPEQDICGGSLQGEDLCARCLGKTCAHGPPKSHLYAFSLLKICRQRPLEDHLEVLGKKYFQVPGKSSLSQSRADMTPQNRPLKSPILRVRPALLQNLPRRPAKSEVIAELESWLIVRVDGPVQL